MTQQHFQTVPTCFQFSIRTVLLLVVLVSWVLAVNRWLGPPYGWVTAIPLVIIELLGFCTRWRSMVGCVVGFLVLCLIGYWFIIGFDESDPRFLKAMVTLGVYGGSAGASIHALMSGRWIVGSLCLTTTIIVFIAIWNGSIP